MGATSFSSDGETDAGGGGDDCESAGVRPQASRRANATTRAAPVFVSAGVLMTPRWYPRQGPSFLPLRATSPAAGLRRFARRTSALSWGQTRSGAPRALATCPPAYAPLAQVKARINAIARTGIPEVNAMTEGFLPRE